MAGPVVTNDPGVAAAALRRGSLAALPTETVYGLGAIASARQAVLRVFAAKGRPVDHPLILHAFDTDAVGRYVASAPPYAWTLAAAFWPGPLTMVLRRSGAVGDWITGGRETVALRVPDHPLTLAVLDDLGAAVAAPSANRFGRVSPTTSAHVLAELGEVLLPTDVVLDGGASAVGVESTIVDCSMETPAILRPGGVSWRDVAEATGIDPVRGRPGVAAPGTLEQHYQPRARVVALHDPDLLDAGESRAGVLAMATTATPPGMIRLASPADVTEFAAVLYSALRAADEQGLGEVRVLIPAGSGLAEAIRDRVGRAAKHL